MCEEFQLHSRDFFDENKLKAAFHSFSSGM
jgi:hypothetical protein